MIRYILLYIRNRTNNETEQTSSIGANCHGFASGRSHRHSPLVAGTINADKSHLFVMITFGDGEIHGYVQWTAPAVRGFAKKRGKVFYLFAFKFLTTIFISDF